jgi:rare lipoprotein A
VGFSPDLFSLKILVIKRQAKNSFTGGTDMKTLALYSPYRRVLLSAFVLAGMTSLSIPCHSEVTIEKKEQNTPKKIQKGKASYYCNKFHGGKTACGLLYYSHHSVAAHPSFPFGTIVQVTNLENNRKVNVQITDRGPSRYQQRKGVIIDLSRGAAEKLRMVKKGRALVQVEVLKWGKSHKNTEGMYVETTPDS